jgi:peroxiredoxin
MALTAALSVATSVLALNIGDKAPKTDVKMKNVDGQEVSIASVAGPKGTLVVFSCNHCPFAKAWEGRIAEIGNTYRGKGIGVIVINSNDPGAYPEDSYDQMQKRAKDRGFEFPYVVDATSDVARAFGASHTPEVYLIDKDGKLVYHGAVDDNSKDASKVESPYLKDALNALLAGNQIATKETKAIGCSIKFRGKA